MKEDRPEVSNISAKLSEKEKHKSRGQDSQLLDSFYV